MPGKRLPISVLEARGKKKLTKQEIAEREKSEIKTPECKRVRWPDYLPKEMRKEFNEISEDLIKLKIFCKLDRDALAMYLMARSEWQNAQDSLHCAIVDNEEKKVQVWSSVSAGLFKQCRQCANELGLNITSRCRLVIPKAESDEEENPFEALARDLA